jgi:3-hydroxyacyl-CoA dehydrogenase
MVEKNLLGQKTMGGFYAYDKETRKRAGANPAMAEILNAVHAERNKVKVGQSKGLEFKPERLFLPMINEAFLCLQERICAPEDLDPALCAGLGMRTGPLAMATQLGLENCLSMIEEHFDAYGERFRPAPLLKRYVWGKRTTIS